MLQLDLKTLQFNRCFGMAYFVRIYDFCYFRSWKVNIVRGKASSNPINCLRNVKPNAKDIRI